MSSNLGEIFCGGATTSQHVDADDDDHFQNTTFKLKRTRSLGLLDEFIDSEEQEKQIERHNNERENKKEENYNPTKESKDTNTEYESIQGYVHDSNEVNEPSSPTLIPNSAFLTSPDILPHDDSDLVAEPSRHVDYLSHQWDVSDISKSWRYVISRRKNVANAARLENASWRTWAQRRSNLKTISPEEVNWSKESDVTWLYGPIVDDDDHDHDCAASPEDSRSFSTASSVVAGDISIARKTHGPKPILKKRTVEDIMISHSNLLKLEIATARAEQEQTRREDAAAQARRDAIEKSGSEKPPEYFDYDLISAKLNSQYKNISFSKSTKSSSIDLAGKNNTSANDTMESSGSQSAASDSQSPSGSTSAITHSSLHHKDSSRSSLKEKRRIHFNEVVQQSIILNNFYSDTDEYDEYEDDENDYNYEGEDNYLYQSVNQDNSNNSNNFHYDDDDDDDDEGGFFLNVRSPSSARLTGALPGLSQINKSTTSDAEEEFSDASSADSIRTIQLLPPTTLNYGSDDEDSDDCNPYTSSISHNVDSNSSRGYDYYYDYNTVYQVDPNHAIYGDSSRNKTPDVVDVPENITVGSNFDYEIIENEHANGMSGTSPEMVRHISSQPSSINSENKERLPISSLDDSAMKKERQNPFSLDASDSDESSDSDDGEGLSISARNSSQSLAQSVFGQQMTSMKSEESHYPQHINAEPEPEAKHISSINPNYSSTSLSKQPHSSNSLSDQFFGGGLTKADEGSSLGRSFFNLNSENSAPSTPHTQTSFSGTQSAPVQKKATALPPHTTSAYAFSGSKKTAAPVKSSFIFDSESDSEEELGNDEPSSSVEGEHNRTSYSSLYEVAGRNGITVPNPDTDDGHKSKKGMTSFLGGWNKGNSS
ncbi:hypothetical protein JCM33374_g3917 [Metschnikowia sp. JCM 33374]|nr:hypothetical protein JCM33374_g3917 [Metschnikowia sp. JCM 33374]